MTECSSREWRGCALTPTFPSKNMRPIPLLLLTAIALSLGATDHRYENKRYGYTFAVPNGWRVERGDTPYIFNYQGGDEGKPSEIPEHGAGVRLLPMEVFVRDGYGETLDEWIRWNTRIKQRDIVREDLQCDEARGRAQICSKVRSISQITGQDPAFVYVSYYFLLDGNYFRAFLAYREGDVNGKSYESTLKAITLSVVSTKSGPKSK